HMTHAVDPLFRAFRASHIAHQLRMGGAAPDFFWQEDVVPWIEIYPGLIRSSIFLLVVVVFKKQIRIYCYN
ncbi:MAG: hypothetical protein ACK55Z_34875, partial [bacterium]